MKQLKVANLGLISVWSNDVVEYNRAEIMRYGWELKKAGNANGISEAWAAARTQMDNMKALIAETKEDRADYIETYQMTLEVAGEYLDVELEDMAMRDAVEDYKFIVQVMKDEWLEIGVDLDEESECDRAWRLAEEEFKRKEFRNTQKERMSKFFGKEAA